MRVGMVGGRGGQGQGYQGLILGSTLEGDLEGEEEASVHATDGGGGEEDEDRRGHAGNMQVGVDS